MIISGMICIYKKDFLHLGGHDTSKTSWGGEDISFIKKAIRKSYKIIR